MTDSELTTALVGYQARASDGETVIGEIQGVRPRGVRIHDIPGRRRSHGYVPAEAIDRVDRATGVVVMRPGVSAETVAESPPPPDESPDGWHLSTDWWADLLGHYGLYDAEGKGDGPYLHAGRR